MKASMIVSLITLAFWMCSANASVRAEDVLCVDVNATGPIQDGSSWCNRYVDLQDALVAATSGTEIHVADGTYTPDRGTGDRKATFKLKNGVALRGGYAGCGAPDPDERDIRAVETILSGDLNADDRGGRGERESDCCSEHLSSGCDNSVCEDIVCSASPGCCGPGGWPFFCAGLAIAFCCDVCPENSMRCDNSYNVVTRSGTDETAVLDGCTIEDGNANVFSNALGGGIYIASGSPQISNCLREDNSAGSGGAAFAWDGTNPTFTRCRFRENVAGLSGGGVDIYGAATLTSCAFVGNSAGLEGGGARIIFGDPTFINCTFVANSASAGGGVRNITDSGAALTNCMFVGNSALQGGGLENTGNSAPRLVNCTIAGNTASYVGGMRNVNVSGPTVIDSIVWGNSDDGGDGAIAQMQTLPKATVLVQYSLVLGFGGAQGNIDTDPEFVDPDGPDNIPGTEDDDLRLLPCSPAIDAGDNAAVPPDTLDLDGDGDTDEPIPFDFDGKPRFVDDPGTLDTGNGTLPVADMGAYEFQALPGTIEDCNGNGIEDSCDLDQCPENPACSDCNENGVLDECDIVEGTSSDGNGDGVPDECFLCKNNSECDDASVCTFDVCINGVCTNDESRYGDVAGLEGACGPDDNVALVDILAVLDGFQGIFRDGCEFANMDIAGSQGSCIQDGSIDLSDILAVLDAFAGSPRCCVEGR